MGHLDFAHHAGFSWYCLFLMFSGVALLLIAVLKMQPTRRRIYNALFGIGYFAYGFYLTFIFGGGTYFVFFYAFIVPVLLIMSTFRRAPAPRPQQPLGVRTSNTPVPGLQPMADPGLPPVADPGLPPVADPGVPPTPAG